MPADDLVGNHVRRMREARGLYLIPVAAAIQVSKAFLARAELGQSQFRVLDIARLARALTEMRPDLASVSPYELAPYRGFPCPCCCHFAQKDLA